MQNELANWLYWLAIGFKFRLSAFGNIKPQKGTSQIFG